MKKILVTGGKGQLALCLEELSANYTTLDFTFVDVEDLDITNQNAVNTFFKTNKIDYCINCAAYTAVDKAETEPEIANKVNCFGPKYLADVCYTNNIVLIHISTDFVFDGNTNLPYSEDSVTNPISVYGKTKLDGEKAILSTLKNTIIIRTSWLYSEYGANFVKTMLRLSENHKELNIISDQIGTPTYAKDLASCIIDIINSENHKFGIYNYSNEGVASWYDFAKAIFEIKKPDTVTKPIATIDYPTPANRPNYSVLNKEKIKQNFQIEIPYWRDSLKLCLKKL